MNSSSLLADVRIYYRIQLYEPAEDTSTDRAELVIQIRPGLDDKVYLQSRSLSIIANGTSFEWPGRGWYDIPDVPAIRGTITTVRLEYDGLVSIAEAAHVEGNLGGKDFDWSYKNREPMR